MIEKLSGSSPVGMNVQNQNNKVSYDIHNISPNEMDALTLSLFKSGEISLKDRLAFVPLDTSRLGENLTVKYYSRVWDDPNRKRDMMVEFKTILQEQIRDSENQVNIDFTRNAIAVLERMEQNCSFKAILERQMSKA